MAKSDPIGIRFDREKLELIKAKEGLDSPQRVVNFLMDQYWWQNKLVVTAKENQVATLPYIGTEVPETPPYEVWQKKIKECESALEVESVIKAAQTDKDLRSWQTRELERQATQKCKSFGL